MSKTSVAAQLVIDTRETQRKMFDGAPAAYTYPAALHTGGGIATVGGFGEQDFSGVGDISIEFVVDGELVAVDMPSTATHGIASYLRATRWDQPDANCETFALHVAGVQEDDLLDHDFNEVTPDTVLQPGDLLSVGSFTNWRGIEFAKLVHMVHWGIYAANGIALNVTSAGGILAGTPIEHFGVLYPNSKTYKVTREVI